ncbi:MAG: hypothetical protein JXA78_06320 [Anaerolineales bacterium]|nr:hypothetical protein [Anaerolineales bacterium]
MIRFVNRTYRERIALALFAFSHVFWTATPIGSISIVELALPGSGDLCFP